MTVREGKSNIAARQDARHPQLSELSVAYAGFTENIVWRALGSDSNPWIFPREQCAPLKRN